MITNQIITYPTKLWKIAEHISIARTLLSKNIYAEGTEKFRGEQEKEISINGVMGELIAQWYCNTYHKDKKMKFAPLLDITPKPEPDLKLEDGTRMDIKATPLGKDFCNINSKAHNNPDKKVDWYWCVKLINKEQCKFRLFKHHEVYLWEQKNGYTEYFSRRI